MKNVKNAIFFISVIFAICAISSELTSKTYFQLSTLLIAKSITTNTQDTKDFKIQSISAGKKGNLYGYIGAIFAATSIFLWIASRYWKEKKLSHWFPLLLVTIYLLINIVLII